jgi:hypothetical protein
MTIRSLAGAVGIALLLANPAWAQSSTTSTASFDSLSPGNQKIADALFSAQRVRGTSASVMTRDQIAALRSSEGWGREFKQMKADGLIQARNLGQVVSQHEHQLHASTTSTSVRSASAATSRTATARRGHTGGGHATRLASAGWRGHAGAGGRGVATAPRAFGGGFESSGMSGFGDAGMGGGFGGGHGGGHGR